METNTEKPNQENPNAGVTVLQQNQSAQGLPTWAKSLNTVTITIVGVLLALGVNFGSILTKWVDSRVEYQTTETNQQGKLQTDSLSALIALSNGQSQHIVDLTTSVQLLIEENKKLSAQNETLNQTLLKLQENVSLLQLENEKLRNDIALLKTQISELQKQQ